MQRWFLAGVLLCGGTAGVQAGAPPVYQNDFETSVVGELPAGLARFTGLTPGVSDVLTVGTADNLAGTGSAMRITDGNENAVMARTATIDAPQGFSVRFRYHGNATADRSIYVLLVDESVATPSASNALLSLELFQSATNPPPGASTNASGVSISDAGNWRSASAALSRSVSYDVEAFVNLHDTAPLSYVHLGAARTLTANRFDVWVDGALAASTPMEGWSLNPSAGLNGDGGALRLAFLTQDELSGADFTFDDLAITQVPEPAGLAILLMASVPILTRRRTAR